MAAVSYARTRQRCGVQNSTDALYRKSCFPYGAVLRSEDDCDTVCRTVPTFRASSGRVSYDIRSSPYCPSTAAVGGNDRHGIDEVIDRGYGFWQGVGLTPDAVGHYEGQSVDRGHDTWQRDCIGHCEGHGYAAPHSSDLSTLSTTVDLRTPPSRSGSVTTPAQGPPPLSLTGHRASITRTRTRVHINVSGHHFEMSSDLLDRHPDTLLGNPVRRRTLYDQRRDELFLDRHRPSFEAIFSYYQIGGKLRRPLQVPDDIFLAEVLFYELESDVVEEYKLSEGYVTEEIHLPRNEVLRQIWMRLEYPETSRSAYAIAVVSVVMTLVSIVLFCVETLPVFAMTHCNEGDSPNFLDPFFVIETVCTIWFTVELILRFAACPSKVRFWRDFKNIVDLTAIIPYYVTFVNVVSTMSCVTAKSSASLAFLRVIRLIRVFKLTKHSVGLQVLILTFKASIEGLSLFLVALTVCLLVYSSAIYYAELGIPESQIQSIPDAFWWAIITMTTVGYGDKVPVGTLGRIIGAACAITGVLTLAIPVPIITGHFNRFYSHKTGRGRHAV